MSRIVLFLLPVVFVVVIVIIWVTKLCPEVPSCVLSVEFHHCSCRYLGRLPRLQWQLPRVKIRWSFFGRLPKWWYFQQLNVIDFSCGIIFVNITTVTILFANMLTSFNPPMTLIFTSFLFLVPSVLKPEVHQKETVLADRFDPDFGNAGDEASNNPPLKKRSTWSQMKKGSPVAGKL